MDVFNSNRQFLKEAHAYPLTSFPGHTQEALLGQLLRKKLEPRVEDWIDEYTVKAERESVQINGTKAGEGKSGLGGESLAELWRSASTTSQGIVGPMLEEGGDFEDDYTLAEREAGVENVVTGLKRKLYGEDESQDGDEDDEDETKNNVEDVMPSTKDRMEAGIDTSLPAMPLDSVLRFVSTGVTPRSAQPSK